MIAAVAACLAAACEAEPEGRALLEDANLHAAEPDCARIVKAGEIARLAGLARTGEALHEAALKARCEDSFRAEPSIVRLSDGPFGRLARWRMQVASLWDPYTRLYLTQLASLPSGCAPGPALASYPAEILIPAYLSDPDRRVILAQRAAAEALSECTQAALDLAEASQALGEPEFAQFWELEAMHSPSPLAASLRLDRTEAACGADPQSERCVAEVAEALIVVDTRARLFDFETIERALTIEALYTVEPPDEYGLVSGARETLTAWALVAPNLGWSAAEPAIDAGEALQASERSYLHLTMTPVMEAIGAGLFDPSLIPGAPPAVTAANEACADRAQVVDELAAMNLLSELSSDDLRCLQALGRLIDPFKPYPFRGAQELVAALHRTPHHAWDSPALIEMASRVDRDMLSDFPVSEILKLPVDDYDCPRPEPHLEPVWNAAAPTLNSQDCDRLAAARPDPADAQAIAALIPFETCADDLFDAPAGVQRRWQVAVRAGQQSAYACALEMVRASPRHPPSEALFVVHGGAMTGRLPQDTLEVLRREGVRVELSSVFAEILGPGMFPELAAEFGPQLANLTAAPAPAKPERDGPRRPKPAPDPSPPAPKPGRG